LILGSSTAPGTAAIISFKLSDTGPSAPANTGGSTLGTLPIPTNHGFLTTDGTVALTTGLKFEVDGTGLSFVANQPYSYQIGQLNGWASGLVNYTNPASFNTIGFFASSLSAQVNGAGMVFVNFSPVPEPTAVLTIAALATLGARYFRRPRRDLIPEST
jgi:hypothetical protein